MKLHPFLLSSEREKCIFLYFRPVCAGGASEDNKGFSPSYILSFEVCGGIFLRTGAIRRGYAGKDAGCPLILPEAGWDASFIQYTIPPLFLRATSG